MIKAAQAAPMGKNHRVSSDSAWPLRGPDGKTFAERRAEREKEQSNGQTNDLPDGNNGSKRNGHHASHQAR